MQDSGSLNPSLPPTTSTPFVLPAGAATQVALQVEPTIKEVILLQAIQGAQQSIWAEIYEFTDPDVALALDQQAKNNIDVQVLYFWKSNNPRMQSMQSALQAVAPAGQQFPTWAKVNQARHIDGRPIQICHAKFMLIDAGTANQQAFLLTANFTESALGVGTFYNNREYVIIDTNQQDIDALTTLFRADQLGQPPALSADVNFILTAAPNLVISSINSYHVLQRMIDSAQASIAIQMEELNDPAASSSTPDLTIESTLLRAAQRLGTANVRIMLPPLTQNGPIPAVPSNQSAVTTLTTDATTPVQIKTTAQYYMHAKLILIDQRMAFVGSENLSWESLNRNREVGILISDPAAVQQLSTTFDGDWNWTGAPQTTSPAS